MANQTHILDVQDLKESADEIRRLTPEQLASFIVRHPQEDVLIELWQGYVLNISEATKNSDCDEDIAIQKDRTSALFDCLDDSAVFFKEDLRKISDAMIRLHEMFGE